LTTIAGAGMAGLVVAVRARQLGADVRVYEKGDRAGGSLLLSSGVVWRHLRFEDFRLDCPHGDERLQRLIWERLDESLAWLESTTGVRPLWDDTENPRTTGRRYDSAELTAALSREAGAVHFGQPFPSSDGLVLATGGFPVRVARERGLLIRSNPWSEGDGLDHARGLGAAIAGDLDELYARAMPAAPAQIDESDYVRLSQLYGGRARVTNERGEEFFPQAPAWHENDLAQAIARQPGGTAWFELDEPSDPKVQAARDAGGEVVELDGRVRVHVAAGVTHTLGGLRVDERARVLRGDGTPIAGLLAAGVDVGGIASGGYTSGLAQALVLGLVAAESLAG
jgi:succinate dehydrogenase/fumarate reductase flavoprotein subunit